LAEILGKVTAMPPHRNSTQHGAGPTRLTWARAALVVAVAALGATPGAARADDDPVKISAQTDRASGRLVLEWRRPVTYTAMRAGDYILIRFSQPVTGELGRAHGTLGRYVAEMRLAGGGRVLVLRLSGEPEFTHRLKGQAVVLTWIGAQQTARRRPAENPTDSDPNPLPVSKSAEATPVEAKRVETRPFPERPAAPRSIEATPLQPKPVEAKPIEAKPIEARPVEPERVVAKPGDATRFERAPVDPKRIEAKPIESKPVEPRPVEAKRIAAKPGEAGRVETTPIEARPTETKSVDPRRLEARPVAARAPRSPSESTDLPPMPSLPRQAAPARPSVVPEPPTQFFSSPTSAVPLPQSPRSAGEHFPARPVERPDFAAPAPNAPAHRSATPGTPIHGEEATPSRPARPPSASPERTSPLHQAETPAVPPPAPRAEEARPAPTLVKAPGPGAAPAQAPIRPAPEARPAPDAPIEPPIMPAISPMLTVTSDSGETRIAVAWPEPMGAAVFRYGDNIWMVFSRREPFDVKRAQSLLGPGVEKLTRIEHVQATILVARVAKDVRVQTTHERNVWTVVMKRDTTPVTPPDVKLAISRGSAEQVALPLSSAEAPIRITAPEIGTTLFIVPSRTAAAVAGERNFVTFRIVPAVQGALIEAVADGIGVATESAAIMIRRSGGLLLSNGTPAQVGQ
jgi:hypothetical protein